jgi:hypothetical protein
MYLKEPALVRNPSPQSIGLRAIPSRHGGCRVSLSGLNEIADIATAISAGVLILSFMATLHMHDQCHPNGLWCGRRDSNPHSLRRWNLNPVRLPIPPRPHVVGLEGLEPPTRPL